MSFNPRVLSAPKRLLHAAIGIGSSIAIGIVCTITTAHAVPPTLNSSGLSPAQCYRRDSDCTQMCGKAAANLRYQCFGICDRMLDRCLETGDWSDTPAVEVDPDPGTCTPPDTHVPLSALLLRMVMVLSDRDGDGTLTTAEIDALKDSVFEKETKGKKKPSPKQQ